MFRKLKLTLKHSVQELKLENTELLEQNGLAYEFLVKGDVNTLIKNLDDFHVWLFCILDPITMPY